MKPQEVPFNIELMELTREKVSKLKPVTSLDITEGSGENFHEEGLFSTSIFGRVGSDERDIRFSFIDIRTTILHPFIFKNLIKLKGLYRAILSGRGYAKWDPKIKDFVQSDELNGQTGYYFFMSHWKEIKFQPTGSDIRDMRIKLIDKFKDKALTDKILVLPAGLRDVQVDANGRMKMDEINDIYFRIISLTNSIGRDINSPIIDTSRFSLQLAFNALYDHLETLISGKDKFIQKKWASRRIFNGTRNVISTMDTSPKTLGAINSISPNNTVQGLYQTMKGVLPRTKYVIRNGWVKNVFNTAEGNARLVNKKTLKAELVKVKPESVDRWTSNDGLEKVINSFSIPEMRAKAVEVEGYYIGLIYTGSDMTFKIFGDIDELPENLSRDDVHPISYAELLYLSDYNGWYKYPTFVTRYPIGQGSATDSIYPSMTYVKTTIEGEVRRELNDEWKPFPDNEHIAREFPSRTKPIFLDSLVPHPSRLQGLSADFDGDMASSNNVYTENAIKEVEDFLRKKSSYIDPEGNLRASPSVHTVKLVLNNMTGD